MVPVIELPEKEAQTAFNLARWAEVLTDSFLARIEGRIETDRFGRIIMSPPPGLDHGSYQFAIGSILRQLLPSGRVVTECPISTRDGVRACDVAWLSPDFLARLPKNTGCLAEAPEICVEVISASNSEGELAEKRMLYFDAGAREVWFCDRGKMTFFTSGSDSPAAVSVVCRHFPGQVDL